MRRQFLGVLLLMSLVAGGAQAVQRDPLRFELGEMMPEFTLASTQGLYNYVEDIYGSHHLILTFFPAAFTPV